jgi:LPS sulfotransferase NodH
LADTLTRLPETLAPPARPRSSYVICTAPRTGSSLLAAALWHTGIAGRPAEYFDIHRHNEAHWEGALGIGGAADYMGKVVAAATTPNGVFGFKLHWHQMRALAAKLAAEQAGAVDADTPLDALLQQRLGETRWIWLHRRNKVAQAISYYRASRSDIWRLPAGGAAKAAAPAAIPYDHAAIADHVRQVESFDRGWYGFLRRRKLQALVLVYEDFIANYDTTVRGVLKYLDLDAGVGIPARQFRRQADAESAGWEQRFRAELAAPKPVAVTAPAPEAAKPVYTPAKRARGRAPAPKRAARDLSLVAYDLNSAVSLPIEPAPPARPWMDAIPQRFAYRCLPLVIANQHGWLIRNTHRVTATWNGGARLEDLSVAHEMPQPYASSHFGSGVLTFNIGCLFRTPPGWNLAVRGPANWPKDGVCALEGIVETDWNRATFTMNWKLTRPGLAVTFEPGEPIAMITPVRRGEIERFDAVLQPLAADPDWQAGYQEWSRSRGAFNAALRAGEPEAVRAGWQRHYTLGMTMDEAAAPEHQTALSLAPFADRRGAKGG